MHREAQAEKQTGGRIWNTNDVLIFKHEQL